jgi:hypothetical protein
MFATVRRYVGLRDATMAAFAERGREVEVVLGSVPGTIGCELVQSRDDLLLLAVGIDERSIAEVGRRFRAWADGAIDGFAAAAEPDLWTGTVIAKADHQEP